MQQLPLSVTTSGLVGELARAARGAGLLLCHWKSNNRLSIAIAGEDDLDFSIPPAQEPALRELLQQFGFLQFRPRPWQRFPGVSDWLGLEPTTGALLHIHLHTRLLTGADGVLEQNLPWLDTMNCALQTDLLTDISVPPKAFDAHLLLAREAIKSRNLRGVLLRMLGRDPISRDARDEMNWLLSRCDPDSLERWGAELWGGERWVRMRGDFLASDCWDGRAFANLSVEVASALAPFRSHNSVRRDLTYLAMRLLKLLHFIRSRSTPVAGKRLIGGRAPIIAIVGSDGAGKSTVTAELTKWLTGKAEVATVYFGTNHGWFRRLRGAVLRLFPGYKVRKAGHAPADGTKAEGSSFPTWLQAVKWCAMARIRLHFLRKAQRLSRTGTIILADRYPQGEVHGTYDGPSRIDHPGLGWLARFLQRDEHRTFARMGQIRPDLVIKLIAPLEVVIARKTDHHPAALARKVETTRQLTFNGARIVEVDASQPIDVVVRQVCRHVWNEVQATAERQRAIY